MSTPSNETDPESAGRDPASASSSVVLPAPLPPAIATSSPGSITNETSCSKQRPPFKVLRSAVAAMRTPSRGKTPPPYLARARHQQRRRLDPAVYEPCLLRCVLESTARRSGELRLDGWGGRRSCAECRQCDLLGAGQLRARA